MSALWALCLTGLLLVARSAGDTYGPTACTSSASGNPSVLRFTLVDLTQTATITKLGFSHKALSAPVSVTLSLWTNCSSPSNRMLLIAQAATVTATIAAETGVEAALPSPVTLPAGPYFIGLWGTGSGSYQYCRDMAYTPLGLFQSSVTVTNSTMPSSVTFTTPAPTYQPFGHYMIGTNGGTPITLDGAACAVATTAVGTTSTGTTSTGSTSTGTTSTGTTSTGTTSTGTTSTGTTSTGTTSTGTTSTGTTSTATSSTGTTSTGTTSTGSTSTGTTSTGTTSTGTTSTGTTSTGTTSTGTTSTGTTSPTTSAASGGSESNLDGSESSSNGAFDRLSSGARSGVIAAIVIGGVLLLLCCVVLIVLVVRRRARARTGDAIGNETSMRVTAAGKPEP